jgi:hypothetical protein
MLLIIEQIQQNANHNTKLKENKLNKNKNKNIQFQGQFFQLVFRLDYQLMNLLE